MNGAVSVKKNYLFNKNVLNVLFVSMNFVFFILYL